jgi:hypothetical protein
VDDAQAGGVDRLVRPSRLRGMRTLHRVVSGGN